MTRISENCLHTVRSVAYKSVSFLFWSDTLLNIVYLLVSVLFTCLVTLHIKNTHNFHFWKGNGCPG